MAADVLAPEPGEVFFSGIRQLTFGGQNAEAYFSADGSQLIFQRTGTDEACDQQYIMNIDGSGMKRVSNGLGLKYSALLMNTVRLDNAIAVSATNSPI